MLSYMQCNGWIAIINNYLYGPFKTQNKAWQFAKKKQHMGIRVSVQELIYPEN